jgi:hypothetical protein
MVGGDEKLYLASESGLYTLLIVHFYHSENRSLFQWSSSDKLVWSDTNRFTPPGRERRCTGGRLPIM